MKPPTGRGLSNKGTESLQLVLRQGRLIVLPTDTVYGVGCDPFERGAIEDLLAVKGRTETKPPPVLGASVEALLELGSFASPSREHEVAQIAEAFWPGPLTLIIPTTRKFGWDTTAVGQTVAVRFPNEPIARSLLTETGPLAVTSANTTGAPPAQTVEEARQYFGDQVALYFDGGPSKGSIPSTILDCSGEWFRIVRQGAIGWEQISSIL